MYYILKEYSAVGKPTRYSYCADIFGLLLSARQGVFCKESIFFFGKAYYKLLFFATRDNTAGKLISDESDVKTCPGKDVVENDILDDWIVISPKKAETIG